jgi:hypothetical protein
MEDQTLKQRIIALCQSEHASSVIELIRLCRPSIPLVAGTEWQTIVNTITIDTHGTVMLGVADLIDRIRKGEINDIIK